MEELALREKVEAEEARLSRKKEDDEIELKWAVARAEKAIEEDKCSHEKKMNEEKMAMEKQKMMDEKMAKAEVENESEAVKLAPNMMEGMKAIVEQFAQIVAQQQEFQTKLIEQMNKPKVVKLGGIQRNSEGITGGSATVQ